MTLALRQNCDDQIRGIRDKLELAEDNFFDMRECLINKNPGEYLLFYISCGKEYNVIDTTTK